MSNFFTDIISRDPRFHSPQRVSDLGLLEPVTRALVQQIIANAQALGITLMAFETFRSQERQQMLFAQGLTQLRTVGVHQFGLACDIVKVVDGEPNWKGDFSFLGRLAHSAGLIWGGDWGAPSAHHSFVDAVHVQRCTVARQPALFNATWYPDGAYNPYEETPHLLFAANAAGTTPGVPA